MDTAEALQIVIDLARQNIIEMEEPDDDRQTEQDRQNEALRIVEDLATNQFGDI